MIKLFRNIRQNLILENKTSKYLKYAIGEIVLVVIGILIALQINNWNEGRKTKLKEVAVLSEILNSINGDFKLYDRVFEPRLLLKKQGLDSLYKYIFNKQTLNDSLLMEFYNNCSVDISIRFDNGPFEALKSVGLEIISNDSLRSKINKAYTVSLPAFQKFTELKSDENNPEIKLRERNILTLVPFNHKNGQYHFHMVPKVDSVLTDENLHWIVNLEENKYNDYSSRLKQMRKIMNDLKLDIENELKHD